MAHRLFSGHNPFGSSSSRGTDKRPRIQNIPEEDEALKSPTQANFNFASEHDSADSEHRPAAATSTRNAAAATGGPNPNPKPAASASAPTSAGPAAFPQDVPTSPRPHDRGQSPEEPPRQPFKADLFGGEKPNANRPRSAESDQAPEESPAEINFPPREAAAGEEKSSSGDGHEEQHLFPPNYGLGRRTSVSAESLNPSTCAADNWTPPHHPKTPEQLARLKIALSNIILFNNLDEDQMTTILDALVEKPVPARGIKIIAQGDQGDFFYVIETGKFDVYKNDSGYVQSRKDGLGTKVATLKEGEFFGELALMYNAPRSASVVSADQKSTVWALDRITFRRILLDSAFTRRQMYEAFLEEVPILSSLKPYERSKVADALRTVKYKPGETIITEGEPGNSFYLLESGTANAYKAGILDEDQPVMRYQRGDYFGELALLDDKPRRATIVAETNVTVAMLHRDGFKRLLGPVQNIMRRTSYDAGRPSTADANSPARGGQEEGSQRDKAGESAVQEKPAEASASNASTGSSTSSGNGNGNGNGKKRLRGSSDGAER
ncbi:cAMP-dependent protein kinase regulatory subunit [Ascosphaera apis ARSEF 7405]|uniref:cAMP-dependent protein kinase regulatory subunit n=1 Tax=Ascosphaera apis ARSEF 7405 TaxID=392613 RepID=A0A162IQT4_9EURO|nr:cAMP-dependent protein kinase regulatory subunit [Ascosphaera apis ARSEF 7405]